MSIVSMHPATTFTQKIVENEGGLVRYITATENGKTCWCFLKLIPEKYREYKLGIRKDQMNIRDYGEVLLCGWGESAPEIAKRVMRKRYDVIC